MEGPSDDNKPHCTKSALRGDASSGLDFNRDNTISSVPYAFDLDADGFASTTFPASQNDWQALTFDARGTIGDLAPWSAGGAGGAEESLSSSGPCAIVAEPPQL